MKKYYLFTLCSLILTMARAQTFYGVLPSTADPNVVNNNDSNYVYINKSVTPLNKLCLFFPGSGGKPSEYHLFLLTAANMGYHTIGLSYNNNRTVGALCNGQPADCQGLLRAEVLYGKDYSPVVSVDSSESIRTRTVALLKYLDKNYPADNWGQFLNGDSIVWSKVCVAGHSQGAGMASIIAYWYNVYRGVFLACGGDWDTTTNNVAMWMDMPSVTPASKKYAFDHRQDELFWGSKYNEPPVIWDTLRLLSFGSYVSVDTLNGNYYGRHAFTSNLTISTIGLFKYHDCVASDIPTPISGGVPVYQPVWQYMLGDTTIPAGVKALNNEAFISVFPNPTTGKFTIRISTINSVSDNNEIEVYNMLGEKVYSQTFSTLNPDSYRDQSSIDMSNEPDGVYFIHITTGATTIMKRIVKI